MQTIWKYTLAGIDRQAILMPKYAKVLSVQMQGRYIRMWVLVNPLAEEKESRKFEIFGTGIKLPEGSRNYIGTVQDDVFVWHIFERLKEPFEK